MAKAQGMNEASDAAGFAAGKSAVKGAQARGADRQSQTLTRADLAESVYGIVGLSRAESARFVEDVLAEIADTLVRAENVKISSFGSFIVRAKTERVGRNPKTGIEAPITARVIKTMISSCPRRRLRKALGKRSTPPAITDTT